MTVVVPTLTQSGWVSTPAEKIDSLMAYFFETMGLQSNTFRSNMTSLQEIILRTGHDANALRTEVGNKLSLYLRRHFANVESDVRVTDPDGNGKLVLSINVDITDFDGKKYAIAELLEIQGTKFKKIAALNN